MTPEEETIYDDNIRMEKEAEEEENRAKNKAR